jgi:hypothetical protein
VVLRRAAFMKVHSGPTRPRLAHARCPPPDGLGSWPGAKCDAWRGLAEGRLRRPTETRQRKRLKFAVVAIAASCVTCVGCHGPRAGSADRAHGRPWPMPQTVTQSTTVTAPSHSSWSLIRCSHCAACTATEWQRPDSDGAAAFGPAGAFPDQLKSCHWQYPRRPSRPCSDYGSYCHVLASGCPRRAAHRRGPAQADDSSAVANLKAAAKAALHCGKIPQ